MAADTSHQPDGGVPRVFALVAMASPLPEHRGLRSIARATEVALRMPPSSDEPFPMRAPPKVFVPGMLFVLTCQGPDGPCRTLASVSTVADTTSVNYQLVMGRVVQAAEQPPAPNVAGRVAHAMRARIIDGEIEGIAVGASVIDVTETTVTFTADVDLHVDVMLQIVAAAQKGLNGAVLRVVRADLRGPSMVYAATFKHASGGRSPAETVLTVPQRMVARPSDDPAAAGVAVSATATRVAVDGVPTIDADTTVTIRSPVEFGAPLRLTAPRGAIAVGSSFVLRFYQVDGARRSVVRATGVRPQAGMIDAVDAVLLRESAPASEAASYRVRIDRFFTADVLDEGRRQVTGRLLDLSAGGVGLVLGGVDIGARLRFRTAGSNLPALDGAEVVIIRRDPRNPQGFGARFAEPDGGRRALAAILDADRAERERLREAKKEATRRGREMAAAAMLESMGRATGSAEEPEAVDDVA